MPAGNVRVQILGLDELAAGTKELGRNIDHAAPSEFGHVADQVASSVSGRVPRRTGRLAGSVRGSAIGDGAEVVMGEGVEYAGYVEYGGRGHPYSSEGNYLGPAAQEAEPALIAAGERAADRAIGATTWPHPS